MPKREISRMFRLAFAAAAMLVSALSFAASAPAPVAMVSDLQGKGTLVKGTARAPLALLADLDSASQVELEANARLVALYLDGSAEYTFKGPAVIAFAGREPQVVKGAQPEKRSVLGGKAKDVQIKSVGVMQGAIVMRSSGARSRIRLLNPSGTRTLEAPPEFRWGDDQPGLTYRFELSDDTGRTLYETETRSTSLKLPAEVTLKEGVAYTWSVAARSPDGRKYSSVADFSIAPPSIRKDVETLRPPATAPFSDRVAYAAWLEQAELKDEARKNWRLLAAERPGDDRLQSLARE